MKKQLWAESLEYIWLFQGKPKGMNNIGLMHCLTVIVIQFVEHVNGLMMICLTSDMPILFGHLLTQEDYSTAIAWYVSFL